MLKSTGPALAAAFTVMLGLSAAAAEPPQDSLGMALQIDDLITLDPAEVFEFTGAEYAANVYDRLVTYPPDAVEDLRGHGLRIDPPSPGGDGRQAFVKDPAGNLIELNQPGSQ